MTNTYNLVPGQLMNVQVSPGSIVVSFDIEGSTNPNAPDQATIVAILGINVATSNVDISYRLPLTINPVSCIIFIIF